MKKLVALCITATTLAVLSPLSGVQAQQRSNTVGFETQDMRSNSATTQRTASSSLSPRCAQLQSQFKKLEVRKSALLKSRKWTVGQQLEIGKNFAAASKNLTASISRCN